MSIGRVLAFIEAPLLVLAAFFVVLRPISLSDSVAALIATLAFVVLVPHILVRHESGRNLRKTALGPPEPEEVDVADLLRAEEYIDKNYPVSSVEYFIEMLTDLPSHLSRVSERMEIDGRVGTVRTTLTYRQAAPSVVASDKQVAERVAASAKTVESADHPSVLVPLVFVRKGLLFDGFSAHDESDRYIPTVSHWEVRGLLVVALRALFAKALAESDDTDATKELNKTERFTLLIVARDSICTTLGRDRQKSKEKLTSALERINGLDGQRFSDEWKLRLRRFCGSLAKEYVIAVEVPRPERSNMILSYRNTVIAARVSRKLEQRLRAKHGLAPVVIDAPMTWALRPDSYHFQLRAPAGLYVFDHHLERLESSSTLKQPDFRLGNVQQYVRLYHEQGHSLAHLYIRRVRYNSDPEGDPSDAVSDHAEEAARPVLDFKSVIRFKEVPPGVLGSAVTISLSTALVISYLAFVRGVQTNSATNASQVILTLMLALPAFLAAGLGRGVTSDNLTRTSLATFYGLWVTVLTSITAVFLFLSDVTRFDRLKFPIAVWDSSHNVNLLWTSLALFSTAIYLILRKEKSDQRRYYLGVLEKAAVAHSGK